MSSSPSTVAGSTPSSELISAPALRKGLVGPIPIFLLAIGVFGLFISVRFNEYLSQLIKNVEVMPLLAMASLVIVLGMSGVYYYAYTFYRDIFYIYLAAGWVGNAVYMVFEGFYKPSQIDIWFSIYVYALAQLSFVPFYFASFIKPKEELPYKQMLLGLCKWFPLIVFSVIIALQWVPRYLPELSPEKIFILATIGGIPFAMFTLTTVARALRSRLNRETHGALEKIFPATFLVWAGVQPLYLFKLAPGGQFLIILGFIFALTAKIVNSILSIVTIHLDFGILRERLKSKTIFEDLGVLTAGIEHDIRNPLLVIAAEIDGMRDKFQSNSEIIRRLARIEDQIARISATTEIIETLRGGPEYYAKFMSKTSLGDLISRSVRAVKGEMKPPNIFFKFDSIELYTRAYQPLLQQVFVNILKNAVEAIREAHRETGLITLQAQRIEHRNDLAVIKIWDNGIGFLESDLERVGTLFSTKKDRKANSGIGLFISRRILAFHGGSLSIESERGIGTTVSVILPLWKEE